jgi:hypothetical protein
MTSLSGVVQKTKALVDIGLELRRSQQSGLPYLLPEKSKYYVLMRYKKKL